MARRKGSPPSPITVQHYREFIPSITSPSIASGVVTPTLRERIIDVTRSAVTRRKQPIMYQGHGELTVVHEDDEHGAGSRRGSKESNKSKKSGKRKRSLNDLLNSVPRFSGSQSNLVRSRSVRSSSPRQFVSTGTNTTPPIPEGSQGPQRSASPHYSPVMLVRRRSTTRGASPRSSVVRRYAQKLFRLHSRAKMYFTKQQLRRQLSFEVVESPRRRKAARFKVTPSALLRFRPDVQRTNSSASPQVTTVGGMAISAPHLPEEPQILAPSPKNLARMSTNSLLDDQFNRFDYDYRDRPVSETLPLQPAPQDLGELRDTVPLSPTKPRRQTTIIEVPRRSSKRHSRHISAATEALSIAPSNAGISTKSAAGGSTGVRSTLPLIRRSDIYGSAYPEELLASAHRQRSHGKTPLLPRSNPLDSNDLKVEDMIDFVSTWSSYLRNAIAVRVVLRQEIHSWEVDEEKKWRSSLDASDASSSDGSEFSSGTYSDSASESVDSSSRSTNSYMTTHENSVSSSVSGDSMPSTSVSIDRQLASQRQQQYEHHPAEPFNPIDPREVRDSLDQYRLSKKYASLMQPDDASTSQSDSIQPSIPQQRSSSDSLISLSRPGREALWLSPGRRPLPQPPVAKQRAVTTPPFNPNSRKQSDTIIDDMYRELHELEEQSGQLHQLVQQSPPHSGDSETNSETAVSSSLKRGRGNGRRARPDLLDNRRLSAAIESSWNRYDSDASSTSPVSKAGRFENNVPLPLVVA